MVAKTVLLSLVVIAALGTFLVNRIADGLLDAKVEAALTEAATGAQAAQAEFNSADRSDPAVFDKLGPRLVRSLATARGPAGENSVLLLRPQGIRAPAAPLGVRSSGADPDAVPAALQAKVTNGQYWTYGMDRSGGKPVPAVIIGSPVLIPTVGTYQLYFTFPLDKEQETLDLVQRTLGLAALGLVFLVGLIAWLVARQVVTPVRMAARIAERLADGRLEERMVVRGEDDLARLAASFNKMASSLQGQIGQLENLSRVQRRFVSDVSHELRTPLTTVRMAADVLHEARRSFGPAVERSAELLQAQLDRFEALLADLLEISRYDAGAAVLEAEPVDLTSVAERVIEATEPLAERRGSTVVLTAPPEPCIAEVDARRIERVVRNLLVNAIEHGEGRPIDVRLAMDEHAVAIAVRDRGVGLDPAEALLVFNRFWRADPARARTSGGTGLGLSIALEDAHLHGGWLQAWGEPGAGSQFRLTVPRVTGQQLASSPIPLEPPDSTRSRRATDLVGLPRRPDPAGVRDGS